MSILLRLFFAGFFICAFNHPAWGQWGRDVKRFEMIRENGELLGEADLNEVEITAKYPTSAEQRKGQQAMQEWTKLRWNVHKVYPYALKVAEVHEQIRAELASLPPNSTKREYVKEKEKLLFAKYEDKVRHMTRDQGRVLLKLIYRETHASMYDMIKDNKSGFNAGFWQGVALVFSVNLKSQYAPQGEDALIETFVNELENGGFNMVYKTYGYTLQ